MAQTSTNAWERRMLAGVPATLAELAAENATRQPCRHCQTRILPENLSRHEAMHEDD